MGGLWVGGHEFKCSEYFAQMSHKACHLNGRMSHSLSRVKLVQIPRIIAEIKIIIVGEVPLPLTEEGGRGGRGSSSEGVPCG